MINLLDVLEDDGGPVEDGESTLFVTELDRERLIFVPDGRAKSMRRLIIPPVVEAIEEELLV